MKIISNTSVFYLDKTVPKGTVVEEVGRVLMQKGGYKLKILNTIDFSASMHYNPFCYLHSETDILSLVTVIMENTQGKDNKGGEDFWRKAEALLYQALIAYIYYEAPAEEKNMSMLLDKLNRLENRKKYLEKGERQKRTHRLCNLGGTIESLAPEVKDLTRTEMTELMEYIFSLSEVQRAVRHMAITHTNQANREKELKADGTISSERHAD